MATRPAKRPKVPSAQLDQREKDDYLPGNIIEIVIHNFMTYDHLVCKPGSRLNLVIGPNGSGKSSIVCAIALGLAGEPQLLGRASSVGAFVKRGEDSGYVKITLRGFTSEDNTTILRKIDTNNKSEWVLNGSVVPKRDLIEVIQKFNIQVNNLTQFLPQDRVCEFAKLTPVQLLQETVKAVGNPQLQVQHHSLVEKRGELKDLEVSVAKNQETMNQLKALNVQQEKDVERVRQRKKILAKASSLAKCKHHDEDEVCNSLKHLKGFPKVWEQGGWGKLMRVETMEKKLPWLKYDMKKVLYKNAQNQEAEAKKKHVKSAQMMNKLTKPIEKQKLEKMEQESAVKKLNDLIAKNAKKRLELAEMEIRLGAQVHSKHEEIEDLRRQEDSRQHRIKSTMDDLAAAQRELDDFPAFNPPKQELEKLGSQILEFEMNTNQVKLQKTEKGNLLNQKKLSLMKCVDSSGVDKIFEAYGWLQQNRKDLKEEVYGPVLLEVKVQNGVHATYLENHVPNYIWKSFVTLDPCDRDLLVHNLKQYDVPVLNFVGEIANRSQFELSLEMRELGICSRLDQVFSAPHAVKEVLIGQAALDHSYVGTNETDRKADEVSRLGITDLWTPESHYRWTVSRYGGHVSAVVDPVHPSRLFMQSVDVGDMESLMSHKSELEVAIADIEETLKVLQAEQRHLEDETAKLHREREEIIRAANHEKKRRRELENRVDQRKKRLESLRVEADLDSSVRMLADQALQLDERRFELAKELKDLLVETIALRQKLAVKKMTCIELDFKVREMEIDIKQHEKLAIQASAHLENCKEETERCRKELHAAKLHAESIAIITPDLAEEFVDMPATIEELEAAIQDGISEANSILFLNQNVLEESIALQQNYMTMRKLYKD
ncbi:hypothetical protein HPP92_016269, partial [Vanilla planifolia]